MKSKPYNMMEDANSILRMLSKRKRTHNEEMSVLTYLPMLALSREMGLSVREACVQMAIFYCGMADAFPEMANKSASKKRKSKKKRSCQS